MDVVLNKRRRMLVFDIDGVLLDFAQPFVSFWNDGVRRGVISGPIFSPNPTSWTFGLDPKRDDLSPLHAALEMFYKRHDGRLPLMHDEIPSIVRRLGQRYHIEMVTSYRDPEKRMADLLAHQLEFDTLVCAVDDKVSYVQKREQRDGFEIVAIFEDRPHHLNAYTERYGGRVWAPRYWNYLKSEHYDGDGRRHLIRFYDSPREWLEL